MSIKKKPVKKSITIKNKKDIAEKKILRMIILTQKIKIYRIKIIIQQSLRQMIQ